MSMTQEMENRSSNITGRGSNDQIEHVLLPLMSVMAALACITNGTVVFLFLKMPRLRTAPNYFLFSLSISDLSAGLLLIPLGLAKFEVCFPEPGWAVQTAFFFMEGFISFSTAYHVTLTTLDRYVAIVFPLKHYILTKKTAKIIIVSLWVIAMSLASIQLHWHLTNNIDVINIHAQWWNIFRLVVVFGLPYPVMIYAFIRIFIVIIKGSNKKLTESICRSNRSTQQRKNEFKPVVIFLLMALLFAACWLPWFVTSVASVKLSNAESLSVLMIHFLTPITNPLLYTFLKQEFKTALKETLHCLPKDHSKNVLLLRQAVKKPAPNLQSQQTNGVKLYETAV